MLKTLSRAFATLAMLFAPAAYAQEVRDADPALWVVKDADTTIYLFGTVHALKPGLSWFDEAVKDAFDKSDSVMLEIVEPDPAALQGLVLRLATSSDGATVSDLLPEDKRKPYADAMTAANLPPAMFEKFDPWFPAITLTAISLPKFGYQPDSGAERAITAAAKAAGKPIGGLETPEQQLGYFDGLPRDVQVRFLVQTVDELPEMGVSLDKMVASWAAGDPDGLAATMNEGMREMPEVGKALLTDRNARWADWIEKRMGQPGTVFIAVGAGHLAGPDSVQSFLAKRKLEAVRIPY